MGRDTCMYTKDGGGGGGGGRVLPISLPGKHWLYVLAKAEHRSPTVDTYNVKQRLIYVLEHRSPTEGGKGGGGGQFLRKGDNI